MDSCFGRLYNCSSSNVMAESGKQERWDYHKQVQMNKPMKFMGLSSIQLFIVVGILGSVILVCMSFLKTPFIVPLFIDGVLFVPTYYISKKFGKEHKKGN